MEKFLNKLAEDANLRSEFLKQTTPEGAYNVAKPYIGDMSMEEFANKLISLANIQKKVETGELSEDELNTVAGGFSLTSFLKTVKGISEAINPEGVSGAATAVGQTAESIGQAWSGIKGVASSFKKEN